MTPAPIALRPICPEDEEFLFAVYSGTRGAELDATGWAPAQRAAFLRGQFDLQHRHYMTHFADAQFSVVERAGVSAGRIYVHRGPVEISIVEIALLPEHCGAGIGTRLVKEVIAESARTGLPVTAYVEWGNERSLRFFSRLGFAVVAQEGAHFKIEWKPA
jgi:ribosomal protein S18 acetylase RimI-like enzyme